MNFELKIQEDAFDRAEQLAAELRIEAPYALGHLTYLWWWAIRVLRPNPQAAPNGFVMGRAAVKRIEAAARWRGKEGVFVEALLAIGLVTRTNKKLRVKGTEPYARDQRRKERAQERERKRRIEKKKQLEAAAQPQKPKLVPVEGKPQRSAALACFAVLMIARTERHGTRPEMAPPLGFEDWYSQLREEGLIDQNIIDGWHLFLEDDDFSKRNWPLAVFMHAKVFRTRVTQSIRTRLSEKTKAWDATTKHGEVFQQTLTSLRARGAQYAAVQLERLVPVSFDGKTLVAEASDRFFAAWVDEHYVDIVNDALKTSHPGTTFRCAVADSQQTA